MGPEGGSVCGTVCGLLEAEPGAGGPELEDTSPAALATLTRAAAGVAPPSQDMPLAVVKLLAASATPLLLRGGPPTLFLSSQLLVLVGLGVVLGVLVVPETGRGAECGCCGGGCCCCCAGC